MQVTATQAKNRFGAMCAHAKTEPVFVEKDGQIDTVILSVDLYRALQAKQNTESLSTRKQQFESEFAEWITAQNAWIEAHGIPGADLRPW